MKSPTPAERRAAFRGIALAYLAGLAIAGVSIARWLIFGL